MNEFPSLNSVDLKKIYEQVGIKPPIYQDPKIRAQIGELLNHYGAKPNKENSHIVSKEPYTYSNRLGQKMKGTLVKYDDGKTEFLFGAKDDMSKIVFKNDKDFEHKKPLSIVRHIGQENEIVEKYSYHRNGEPSRAKTYNHNNTLIVDISYDRQGKMENKKVYDKKGELLTETKVKNEDGISTFKKFDKDKNLLNQGTIKYDENGKKTELETLYPDGSIREQTTYWDNGVIRTSKVYDKKGNLIKEISPEIDNNFGNSSQKNMGDCYLLSSINAIRGLADGQEMLQDLVEVSTNDKGEKVYTVTFPGAVAARESLMNDPRIKDKDSIAITGSYSFTESEMEEILKQAGKNYSIGDADVILLEAAFREYRIEAQKTMKANGIKDVSDEAGLNVPGGGKATGEDILAGGRGFDSMYILTGKPSRNYQNQKVKTGIDTKHLRETGEIRFIKQDKLGVSKGISEIEGPVHTNKTELDKMLDDIEADAKDGKVELAATASFKMFENGKSGGHLFAIKSVEGDTVTLINPWHPDKEIKITREELLNNCKEVSIADFSKTTQTTGNEVPNVTPAKPNNSEEPNAQPTQNNNEPQKLNYKVRKGLGYTQMIKEELRKQGIATTSENIRAAKKQFETANPDAIHIYHGKRKEWHGNKFLFANAEVYIPKFDIKE